VTRHIKSKLKSQNSKRNLISEYRKRKKAIIARLREFEFLHRRAREEEIFQELCFCLLTANANAVKCHDAICDLKKTGLILKGACPRIRPYLKGRVRFHNKKAEFIVGARKLFKIGRGVVLRHRIDPKDIVATRDWLVENVKGLGYKEASHFLRNIGLGSDIAILDRHILKNLKRHGVISKIPPSVGSRKIYLDIEDKMRAFSRRIRIPMSHMDLLFWSIQTGFIFK